MSEQNPIILVVDDEPAMRAMAKAMLESMGFRTALAHSGEQALETFKQSQELGGDEEISMAIMDLTLPGGISGVETLQELQELDSEFPVVATSGYLEDNAYDICQQIGFVGVLPKPYTAEKIGELVRWVISRKGIPGGFDEGMPRPGDGQAEEAPEEETAADTVPQQPVATEGSPVKEPAEGPVYEQAAPTEQEHEPPLDRPASRPGTDVFRRTETGQLRDQAPAAPREESAGEGIADRLSDLVDFAASHRGSGE